MDDMFQERASEGQPNAREPSVLNRVVEKRIKDRGIRRAIVINGVLLARQQAGREKDAWSTEEADILCGMLDLLERVIG